MSAMTKKMIAHWSMKRPPLCPSSDVHEDDQANHVPRAAAPLLPRRVVRADGACKIRDRRSGKLYKGCAPPRIRGVARSRENGPVAGARPRHRRNVACTSEAW